MSIEKMINSFIYGYGNGYTYIFACVHTHTIKPTLNILHRLVHNLEILTFKNPT